MQPGIAVGVVLVRREYRELRIGGGAGAGDGAAALELRLAAERGRVHLDIADHALEHLDHRHRALLAGEGGVDAMALRLPLVLDDDGALHRVEVAIAPAVEIEVACQGAIERGDGDRVLHQRAGIGRAQLERCLLYTSRCVFERDLQR